MTERISHIQNANTKAKNESFTLDILDGFVCVLENNPNRIRAVVSVSGDKDVVKLSCSPVSSVGEGGYCVTINTPLDITTDKMYTGDICAKAMVDNVNCLVLEY
jgi:uncharacterized protein YpuA (DUF1002 family)